MEIKEIREIIKSSEYDFLRNNEHLWKNVILLGLGIKYTRIRYRYQRMRFEFPKRDSVGKRFRTGRKQRNRYRNIFVQ